LAGLVEGLLATKIWFRLSFSHLSPLPTVVEKEISIPRQVNIPKLGLITEVMPAGRESDGEMAVPEDPWVVAWYQWGAKLGEKGNAVIAGHLDSKTGPAVFYHLSQLTAGDEVLVKDQNQKEFVYIVVKKETYNENNFPVTEVFGESDKPRLNLITCRGQFNRETKRYTKRIVIYTELRE